MIENYQSIIDERIAEFIRVNSCNPDFEIIKYILDLKGKRVRPSLLLLSTELFGGSAQNAIDQAVAIEFFHNFTLLHDDIMDEAPLRRGKETAHLKWGVDKAILAGDILFAHANMMMANCSEKHLYNLLSVYNKTAIEVCEGQQMDLNLEKRRDVDIADYIEMIKLKTSVLLACALKIGAIVSDAEKKDLDLIYDFGLNLGIAFQIHDDILDVYSDNISFGKQKGGDIIEGKKTALFIIALSFANEYQKKVLRSPEQIISVDERVANVIEIYEHLGVKKKVEQLQEKYFNKAIQAVSNLSISEINRNQLISFANRLMKRTY